ncbi:MAG: regulatory protein RecX [Lachnospiraceae bacterium]|nr:regulatory protein RecX [Lachnospiraceae bacterium]
MRVTQIVELSKSRSKIFIDQEFAFVLYKGELNLYHISEGEEMTKQTYQTIMDEVLPKRAKLRAMNLLKSREYTTMQLRIKLQQGFYPQAVIDEALDYVADFHYIDDLRYATDYITYNETRKSRKRMEQDLQKKGIAANVIEEAFGRWQEQGGEQDEQGMIKYLLEKKHYNPADSDYKEKQKIYAFLVRKGFASEQIRRAIGEWDFH